MKRPRIRIIGIKEGEEMQLKNTENILNKIIEENFPRLKKRYVNWHKRTLENTKYAETNSVLII